MKYLITASSLRAATTAADSPSPTGRGVDTIAESLTRSNVILEAFGNAKTVRNDNSSRFGKYIKLMYDAEKFLIGAYTEKFLLEKTRLMQADKGERTYHVFYQIIKGLPESTKSQLHLTDAKEFSMLSNGDTWEVPNVDDKEEFEALHAALNTVDIVDGEYDDLMNTLAALLHLANMDFTEPDGEGARTVPNSPSIPLETLSSLLGVEAELLTSAVTVRNVRSGRGSLISMNLTPLQAKEGVAAMVKFMYGEIFSWLVKKINRSNATESSSVPACFIGILDIFGFEIMQYNSLSQLCINFANEKLQQQFNHQVRRASETRIALFKADRLTSSFPLCSRPRSLANGEFASTTTPSIYTRMWTTGSPPPFPFVRSASCRAFFSLVHTCLWRVYCRSSF